MDTMLRQRQLDARAVRERMYRAPTPRGRERWHAIWLLTRGWSAAQVAEAHPDRRYILLRREGEPGALRVYLNEARYLADAICAMVAEMARSLAVHNEPSDTNQPGPSTHATS